MRWTKILAVEAVIVFVLLEAASGDGDQSNDVTRQVAADHGLLVDLAQRLPKDYLRERFSKRTGSPR